MRTLLQNHQRNASMRHDDVRGTTASDLPTRAHPPGLPPRASRAMGLHPAKRRLGRHASKAACRHTPLSRSEGAKATGRIAPVHSKCHRRGAANSRVRALLLPHTARVRAKPCGNVGDVAGAHQWKRAPTRSALRPFRTSHTSTPPRAGPPPSPRPPSSPRRDHNPQARSAPRHHQMWSQHVAVPIGILWILWSPRQP